MRRWATLGFLVLLGTTVVWAADFAPATQHLQGAFPEVQFYAQGAQITRVWGAIFGLGPTPERTADAFVREHSALFNVAPEELQPGSAVNGDYTLPLMYQPETGTYKFTLVQYHQVKDGLPVYQADLRLLVGNEPDNPLVWAGSSLKSLGDFTVPAATLRSPAYDAVFGAALNAVPSLVNFTDSSLVIYAGVDEQKAAPTLAVTFVADNYGSPTATRPERYRFVADATTGAILHQEDLIVFTNVTGNVSGLATTIPKSDTCNPEVSTPMKYAKVSIGSTTAYTDPNGNFTITNSGTSAVTVSSPMSGHYFFVSVLAGTLDALSQSVTPPGPANFVHNAANSDELVRSQINAYVQANVVRDWVLTYNPSYPSIATDVDFPLYVNSSNSTYCPGNAWYDGSALNFCRAGSSYPNTAYSSVVHHEYGHHAVASGGSGQDQYGEGMGDCFAVCLADDPILGYGFTGNCSTGIRTASNTMQYPCTSDIHTCAQLLSGCIWSTRNALVATNPYTYKAILSNLVVNSIPLHSGGSITPQITIDFLTLDDNDGNLSNGTPHYSEICTGFSAHNMTCPALALLAFSFPNGRPELVSPAGGTTVRVVVSALGGQPQPGTGTFYYKIGSGSWTSAAMQVVSPNVYDAVFPAAACGSIVSYYFSAQTTSAQTVYDPSNAPTGFYVATSATSTATVLADDMEIDRGWTVGDTGDTATTGLWTRNVPQATAAQPGSDHSANGTMCWVTDYRAGSSIGDYDVDGGKTTLKSPTLNLAGYAAAKIGYWRWYSNNQGSAPNADTFRVDISNNNGSSWVNAETVGPAGAEAGGGWYYHEFNVGSFVSLTSQVKVRFVAEDAGSGSIVEAAVDDFACVGYACITQYTLTTSVTGSGSIALNPPGGVYDSGASVQCTANAASGWHFDHWTGALSGATNPATLLMDGNKSITAVFVQDQYTLTAFISPGGKGSVTFDPPGGTYLSGTSVQLTAAGIAGWHFDHWTGNLTGATNPSNIVMDGNKSVTAVFVQDQYTLTTSVTGQGGIALDPPGGTYLSGTTVQVTANQAAGWHFDHWQGDLTGTTNPSNIVMDGNKSVTAAFVQNPLGCPGDMNCDGQITFADIDLFVEALSGESSWSHPNCPWSNGDTNGDGNVTFADIDPFVALIGTTCPP